MASVWETIFFAIILLLGCGGLVLLFGSFVVPEWRVNYEFIQHPCKVIDKRIVDRPSEDGPLYRPEIKIEYDVDGVIYSDWHYDIHKTYSSSRQSALAVLDQFSVFEKSKSNLYYCWYNPADPHEAVLVRGSRWWFWLVFTIPISFIVIGVGGLIYSFLHWGKSAERRSAMTRRVQENELFAVVGRGNRQYPSVPDGLNVTNSPGVRLRFRLPTTRSTGWAMFGAIAFCLVWNTCVSIALILAVYKIMEGKPDWLFILLILPFLAFGVIVIVHLVRKFHFATGVGPTFLEISDHPLKPGESYRIFLSQSGQLNMHSLRVSLVCEEQATYRQGTNTRTEIQEVYRQELYSNENFTIKRIQPFEAEFDLHAPDGIMHSFISAHNQINWKLIVDGSMEQCPDFHRAFTVIVRPISGEMPP
jgi:hypothetical protein